MSSILFGYTMSLTTAATPSTGFLVAYDIDGIIKQKDSAGVITPIGGSGSGGIFVTPSLAQVLAVSNDSETHSIIMGTATSVLIGTSGTINMASASSIIMGTATSIVSTNGLSSLHFDYNSVTSSVYLTSGYNYLSLTNATMSLINSLGNDINISNTTNYVKLSTDTDIFSTSEIRLRIFNTSDEILLKSNIGTSVTSTNATSNAVFIGSQNSSFNANVINSVILGGQAQSAIASNSVYVPDTYIQDTKKLRGSLGDASLSFSDTNNLILENSNSLIALISSSSSTTLTTNGIIVSDSLSSVSSPNIDASPVFISTKNSSIGASVSNSVIIGGESLVASLSNLVVIGEFLNINNQYTLPNVDGAAGSYMITDGSGNLTWQISGPGSQNLEDVLTIGNWTGYNSIEMGTGSSLYSVRGGGQINLDYAPDSVVISTDNGNLNKAYIQLDNEDIFFVNNSTLGIGVGSASIVVSDGRGLVYAFDYSATFVTYSLVDKNYVDTSIDAIQSENGIIEISPSNFGLGGTLSNSTEIDGNFKDFKLNGTSNVEIGVSQSLGTLRLRNQSGDYNTLLRVDAASNFGFRVNAQLAGATYSDISATDQSIRLTSYDGSGINYLEFNNVPQSITDGSTDNRIIFYDSYNKGAVYSDDYTANFTTHSLVTKGYVDASIGSFTNTVNNGLTQSSGVISLGGNLNTDTTINGVGAYNFWFSDIRAFIIDSNNISLSASNTYDLQTVVFTMAFQNEATITDNSGNGYGLQYSTDYSATFVTHSLVTKYYVDTVSTSKYSEIRSFTASITETITHSLGTEEILVQTYESGVMVIPGEVMIVDSNSVNITFRKSLSNIKIVIVG